MTVQACFGVQRALICYLQLIHGVVVYLCNGTFLHFLSRCSDRSGKRAIRQSHENSVQPYLISVDGFVPEHLVGYGTGLVLQLFHHQLHGLQVLCLGPLLVHTCNEMSCTYVVQIIVQDIVSAYVAVLVDHRVGKLLTVLTDILATIFKICVEHGLQFYTHNVTPLGLA